MSLKKGFPRISTYAEHKCFCSMFFRRFVVLPSSYAGFKINSTRASIDSCALKLTNKFIYLKQFDLMAI